MSFVLIPSCHIKRSLEFDKAKNVNFATTAQQRDQDTHRESEQQHATHVSTLDCVCCLGLFFVHDKDFVQFCNF